MGALVPFPRRSAPPRDLRAARLATARALVEAYADCFRHEREAIAALRDGDLERAVLRLDLLMTGAPLCLMPDPLLYQQRRASELLDLVLAAHARNKARRVNA
jgi:hypothetical protein